MKKYNCVLLVDDDETSNFISKMVLENVGISGHYHTAKNGKEALEFVKEHCKGLVLNTENSCPELIFLDLKMPVMDGFEFLSEFYKGADMINEDIKQKIKIVVLSSSDNQRDIDAVNDYNILDYIPKPITEEKIKNLINAA